MEMQFLLDSFITCVIRINENEFITGDNKELFLIGQLIMIY